MFLVKNTIVATIIHVYYMHTVKKAYGTTKKYTHNTPSANFLYVK